MVSISFSMENMRLNEKDRSMEPVLEPVIFYKNWENTDDVFLNLR